MEIPSYVLIGPYMVPIEFVENLKDDDGTEILGQYVFDIATRVIKLRAGLTGSLLQDTFYHELFEAINDIYDTDLSHQTIQTLGCALAQALMPLE